MAAKPKIITDLEKKLKAKARGFELNDEGEVVVLDLSYNQIADLSPLAHLTNLESLGLSSNQIADLSPLAHLTNLESLHLGSNQIADLSPLAHLTNLKSLHLWNNKIADLSPLAHLTNLKILHLWNNKIADLSPLAHLTNLEILFLRSNQIADLSPLAHLTNLKILHLGSNQIADLSPLAHLTNLESLHLGLNQIADLSPILPLIKSSRIREISYNDSLFMPEREINLFGNPLPPEVIKAIQSGGKEGLIEYFGALERGSVRIPEAKMVLLGEPRAGKTSLRRYLMGLPFDPAEASTPDIQISAWRPFEADEEADDFRKSIKINLWDFGGQEIQYSLHKLFMTEDTLYVIVLDSTKDQSPLPYLKFLEDYAPHSPFVIVNNQGDVATSNTLKIDENYLRENYNGQAGKPVLKGVFRRVSVLKAAEMEPAYRKIMDEVEACIKTELLQLKNLNNEFPTEYQQVKAAIEAEYAQPDRHYITMSYYRELCKSLNITDDADLRMAILGYLNEIGVLRYFKDSDISYHILNPKWLIDGSYSLIVSEQTASGNGVLTKKEAFEILKRSKKGFKFEEDEARFIFTTMKFYGLLHFDEAEQKVYIPLQFSSVQPVPLSDFYENGQHFYVAFQSDIPEDVMSYLIVKHFEEIGQRIFWRTGAVFEKDNVRVLVRIEDRAIHFYIQGQYHQAYFEQLRSTLHKKLRTLPGLGYDEMVDFEFEGKKIVAKYDDLLTVLREKWGDYRDYSTKTKIPENIIVEILGGYFSATEIQQNVTQYFFNGNYYDQRYQQNLIVHQLNQLVQTTSNEADRKALEEVQAAIKALSQAKDTTQKKSIGQRILGKIKDLAEGTADDALKEKLKELFPEIIEKGIDWAKNLDTETIMQALGGIF